MDSNPSFLRPTPEEFFDRLVSGLSDSGYASFPGLFSEGFVRSVRDEMESLRSDGAFRPAGIGRGEAVRSPGTRGDGIWWFGSEGDSPVRAEIGEFLESVRRNLNESLYLGLWDWEGHYSIYPSGTFYRKHLDRFSGDSRRAVSTVFYFNPDWNESDGGVLRIETANGTVEVPPSGGTAIFFLSDRIPHEVLETRRERFSFAAWFRTR